MHFWKWTVWSTRNQNITSYNRTTAYNRYLRICTLYVVHWADLWLVILTNKGIFINKSCIQIYKLRIFIFISNSSEFRDNIMCKSLKQNGTFIINMYRIYSLCNSSFFIVSMVDHMMPWWKQSWKQIAFVGWNI